MDREKLDTDKHYDDYLFGKQTIRQLSIHYNVSESTVRRKLSFKRSTRIISRDKDVVVLMDATYWGKKFGVVVMKDSLTGKVLWRKFINGKETLADYKVQMCQFHQVQIVKRYLTQSPELEASKELLSIAKMLCHTDKESFTGLFEEWCMKWSGFLKERTRDKKTGKSITFDYYTEKKKKRSIITE